MDMEHEILGFYDHRQKLQSKLSLWPEPEEMQIT